MSTPHRLVTPEGMAPAIGFSHAVAATTGRTVWIAGQIATDAAGAVVGEGLVAQLDVALGNVVTALRAAGAQPEHAVSMLLFTTAMDEYRSERRALGPVWRRHFGRHFPAMALLGVTELVEPAALIEVVTTAVIPDPAP
ncbi:MAG TPA: RidA family protein [Candidatus Dormibacteraeota bacterium]|nr:RidA family protein [Candidatus Dormibacteraeota bacterium]